jgi:hypothetical protein
MSIPRLRYALLICAACAALAACGGGGSNPTPPGGNPGPAPTTGPTATPGATPTPTPTPAGSPTPTPTPSVSSTVVTAEETWINGSMSWYQSGTASWSTTAGDTQSAPAGQTVDGMSCSQVTEGTSYPQTAFSQHVFVGLYSGGVWEALPQAVGMVAPVAPTQGNPPHASNTDQVENNQCEYNLHTHDYSGLVHIEDETLPQSTTSFPPYATLQALFDVWGAQIGGSGITAGSSSLTGTLSIYVGTPSGTDANGNDMVTSYSLFTAQPNALHFSRHMAIWIVTGSVPAQGLPQVRFVIEN